MLPIFSVMGVLVQSTLACGFANINTLHIYLTCKYKDQSYPAPISIFLRATC